MKKLQFIMIAIIFYFFTISMSGQCTTCPLNGPATIETGDLKNYTTSSLTGADYFWSVTGGLRISGSNTQRTVRLSSPNGAAGKVCITKYRVRTEPCMQCKTITVCDFRRVSVVKTVGSCDVVYDFVANTTPANINGAQYEWSASNGVIMRTSGNTVRIRVKNFGTNPGNVNVKVTACNKTITGYGGTGEICDDTGGCGFVPCFTMSPNPSATNGFTLNLDETNFKQENKSSLSTSKSNIIVKIQLLNAYGKTLKSYKTKNNALFIDTSDLKPGMYYVTINGAKGKSTKSMLIR